MRNRLPGWVVCLFALSLGACSSAQKAKVTSPILSEMEGKKVALVSVDGEPTSVKIIEVALVNQLVQKGSFLLISKPELETARAAHDQNPLDWKGLAKRVNADYALQAKVLKFDAKIREGYSSEEVIDSQIAEEQGTDGKTQRVFKVKSLDGEVQVELKFTRLSDDDIRSGIAEASERVEESAKNSAIHLPPTLRFLENLANKAFRAYFDRYN